MMKAALLSTKDDERKRASHHPFSFFLPPEPFAFCRSPSILGATRMPQAARRVPSSSLTRTLLKTFKAVTLGRKLALIFVALALLPLLALSAAGYRSGVGAVERLLRERASERATR